VSLATSFYFLSQSIRPLISRGCSSQKKKPGQIRALTNPSFIDRVGVLIECDPSVKAIILKHDEEHHDYVVEDLDDDRHLVIKGSQLQNLKEKLGRVCLIPHSSSYPNFVVTARDSVYLRNREIRLKVVCFDYADLGLVGAG
jgi:TFIIH basal transcription factor complex TTD-A subunit